MIGQQIGKYRITRQVGRGGMGTVYAALDTLLQREVAIKALNPGLEDPTIAERFRTEAIAVARLNHPGIAAIYELFEHDGQQLMVMEFVRGETLESVLSGGPLPLDRTTSLVTQLLDALAHAHGLGVVHRDLKPANLMLTAGGGIKITDFGIARISGSEQLTAAGFMMGTPAYMAPEQVTGRTIDGRTDLYTVGLVFFQMLTGELPFRRGTAMQVAQARLKDQPRPLSELRQDLPAWVGRVIAHALDRDPAVRFQTADAFRRAIARGIAGHPDPIGAPEPAPLDTLALAGEVPEGPRAAVKVGVTGDADIADDAEGPTRAVSRGVSSDVGAGTPAGPPSAGRAVVIGSAAAAMLLVIGVAWWMTRGAGESAMAAPEPTAATAPAALRPDMDEAVVETPPADETGPEDVATSSVAPESGRPATGAASAEIGAPAAAAPPAGATTAPGPPAPDSRASISYRGIRGFVVDGLEVEEPAAGLTFGADDVRLTDERGVTTWTSLPRSGITSAAYTRAKNPRWYPTLAGPPSNVDLPGGLFRRTYHWLTLQSRDGYIIVRMNDGERERITATVREWLGLEIHELQP